MTVLLIMIILLAVVALVVVNALKDSPWGTFTIAATMPIAIFMGLYLRYWRPGKVLEVSAIGFVLMIAEHLRWPVGAQSATSAPLFTFPASRWRSRSSFTDFWRALFRYGCCWRPRDYLSTFVKLGVVVMLAIGIFFFRPATPDAAVHPIR